MPLLFLVSIVNVVVMCLMIVLLSAPLSNLKFFVTAVSISQQPDK